jgi:hypothetical protein
MDDGFALSDRTQGAAVQLHVAEPDALFQARRRHRT